TAAALTVPESRYDLVRFGGAVYGLSTLPGGAPSWLRPVMTLRARLAMVKRVPAGAGVSYGHHYVTARESTLSPVPLGCADGVSCPPDCGSPPPGTCAPSAGAWRLCAAPGTW